MCTKQYLAEKETLLAYHSVLKKHAEDRTMFDQRVRYNVNTTIPDIVRFYIMNQGTKTTSRLFRAHGPSACPSASTCQMPLAWGQLKSSLLCLKLNILLPHAHTKKCSTFYKERRGTYVSSINPNPSHEKNKHLLCMQVLFRLCT